jgi:hypothetical protein
MHLGFAASTAMASSAMPPRLLHPVINVHLRLGEQVSGTIVPSNPTLGEGE